MIKLINVPLMQKSKLKQVSYIFLKLIVACIVICVICVASLMIWLKLTLIGFIPNYFKLRIPRKVHIISMCVCHPVDAQNPSKGLWSTYTYDKGIDLYPNDFLKIHEYPPSRIELQGEDCREIGIISGSCNPLTDMVISP